MPDAPRDQLAAVAQVTADLDQLLDRLFGTVAELKVILGSAPESPPGPGTAGEQQP